MRVQHTCGWESDGAEFPEGAGCPLCGKPIMRDELKPVQLGGEVGRIPEELTPAPAIVGGMTAEWLSTMTVPEAAAFISEVVNPEELETIRMLEAAGKVRTGVFAALTARIAELSDVQVASLLAKKDAQAAVDNPGEKK